MRYKNFVYTTMQLLCAVRLIYEMDRSFPDRLGSVVSEDALSYENGRVEQILFFLRYDPSPSSVPSTKVCDQAMPCAVS